MKVEIALAQDPRARVPFYLSHFLVIQTGTYLLPCFLVCKLSWAKADIPRFFINKEPLATFFKGVQRFY